VRSDTRQLTLLQYEIAHPPMPRLEKNELAEFYSLVHGLYPFESCVHRGDSGGVIETEGWVTIEISRDGFSYEERVRDDFQVVAKRSRDVFDLAKTHFDIRMFIVGGIMLRQTWPAPDEGNMSERLRDKALKLTPEQYEALGEDVGAGIHLVGGHGDDEMHMHWNLEVDPLYAEGTSLWVELRTHVMTPSTEIDGLSDALSQSYKFLDDNVARFVLGFLS